MKANCFVVSAIVVGTLFMGTSTPSHANGIGPTLSNVTEILLNFDAEKATWPICSANKWWVKGLKDGDKLTTAIFKGKKKVAYAEWEFRANASDDWAQVKKVKKLWPTSDRGGTRCSYVFKPGKYKLALIVGKKTVYHMPFEMKAEKVKGKTYYYPSGMWGGMAYATPSGSLCFWITGPSKRPAWYVDHGDKMDRRFILAGAVVKDGKIVVEKRGDSNRDMIYIAPGQTVRKCVQVGNYDYKTKVLRKDGVYDFIAFDHEFTYGGTRCLNKPADKQYECIKPGLLARLTVTVKGKKLVMNDKYAGDKVDPKTRIYSSDAHYNKNLAPLPADRDKHANFVKAVLK